jgi:cytidylate kinase
MYRAVALYNMNKGTDKHDEGAVSATLSDIDIKLRYRDGLQHILLNGTDITQAIRNQKLAEYTSTIAAYATVREKLTQQQKELAATGSVVMDGRDIASHVLPGAQVKIYLDADVRIRAERRLKELQAKGQPAEYARVWEETIVRDERDKNREHAPLIRVPEAIYIDTSHMTPDETLAEITRHVAARLPAGHGKLPEGRI